MYNVDDDDAVDYVEYDDAGECADDDVCCDNCDDDADDVDDDAATNVVYDTVGNAYDGVEFDDHVALHDAV